MLRVPPAPVAGGGVDHGADHLRVLAHAEIIVRAPDDDVFRPSRRMPHRVREAAGDALEVGKDAVAPFALEARHRADEKVIIIHHTACAN